MKKAFLLAGTALIMMACNKNQKVVKKLDGEWTAISYLETIHGESVSTEYIGNAEYSLKEVRINFDNCKLEKDEYCNTRWDFVYEDQIDVINAEYRITDKGELMLLRLDEDDFIQVMEIVELNKGNLVIEFIDDYLDKYEMKLEPR